VKVSLVLNRLCNLRCTYCYTGEKVNARMSEATLRAAVDFGVRHATQGWLLLAFFGGEPLLEPELMREALSYARTRCAEAKLSLYTALTTNGTLLDEAAVELARRHGFKVKVSVDGGPKAQDAARRFAGGQSSWEKVSQGVRRLLAAGVPTTLGAVVDPANAHLLGESLDALVELGGRHVTFAPNYSGDWSGEAWARFERGLSELGDRVIALARAGVDVRVDPLAGKIVAHVDPGATARAACRFGLLEVAVGPSGRLYPCDRLVNEDDDEAVCIGDLARGLDPLKRDALLPSRRATPSPCTDPEYAPRCRRTCGCANYETTGDTTTASPLVCAFEHAFIDEADRVGNVLFEEQNPLFVKRFLPTLSTKPSPRGADAPRLTV
jgi:uncharacterized protein